MIPATTVGFSQGQTRHAGTRNTIINEPLTHHYQRALDDHACAEHALGCMVAQTPSPSGDSVGTQRTTTHVISSTAKRHRNGFPWMLDECGEAGSQGYWVAWWKKVTREEAGAPSTREGRDYLLV